MFGSINQASPRLVSYQDNQAIINFQMMRKQNKRYVKRLLDRESYKNDH